VLAICCYRHGEESLETILWDFDDMWLSRLLYFGM
jgi:hypothetical protein